MVETVMCGFGVDTYQKQTARENVTVTTENKGSYPQIIVLQHKRILIKELGYRLTACFLQCACVIERPQPSRDVTLLPYPATSFVATWT